MGRPPSNGGPSFRFNPTEVAEMEAILQAHNTQVPAREVLVSLAEKFSASAERSGKVVVQMKQVWNWFQNRRYALRAKAAKTPSKVPAPVTHQSEPTIVRTVPQVPQPGPPPPSVTVRPMIQAPQGPQPIAAPSVSAGRNGSDSSQMEFEAKSARDGAWYDVAAFLSHRSMETGDPEVLVRFAGFGAEEDEWVNVRRNVRQRSLPCESSECVAVLPGDLILCFQEGKEQALYFDAHVLDAQRRRHDVRGCRCRFLVRYDHDQSEEIVPLRKICRRPETDYRLEQLNAESATTKQQKAGTDPQTANTLRVYAFSETAQKPPAISSGKPVEPLAKKIKTDEHVHATTMTSSAHIDGSASTLNLPKAVDHVNAGSNLPPMQQQQASNDAQPGNTLEANAPVESQKLLTESVQKLPAESMPESSAESKVTPPAEPTSMPPAESMPNPTVQNTEEEEHATVAPMSAAISSVPTPNPVESTDEQLNPEENANVAAVAPVTPAISPVTTPNPVEPTDGQLNPEEHANVAATVAPALSSVTTQKPVEPTDGQLNPEEHANVAATVAPAISSVTTPKPVEPTDGQLNPEEHANVAATVAPAISSVTTPNPVEPTDKQLNPEEHQNVAATVAPAISPVTTPNPVEPTDEQFNPEELANVAATVAPASNSAATSNPTEATDKQLKAYEQAAPAVAPDSHTDVSVANEYKDVSTKDAENVSSENVGISEIPIQSDVLMETCDAMDEDSDAVADMTGMLDTGGGSANVQQG
ncbi:mucin-5AC-like isoform X1 [Ipomoea triloba]|uniref:mucin-5AC-like isoform X1 n=1 Tax=Ipomoea triloba TaxID=35885 RepID=UPI00125DB9C9|nr:mucin-5AC-like isoform X1 [Ipomoea triloba]